MTHQGAWPPIPTGGPAWSTVARLKSLEGKKVVEVVLNGYNVSHVIVAFMCAANAAIDMGQRSPAVGTGHNDLTLTSQRRDKQKRVRSS
ncbi:hypothetical protein I546_2712 [Mycobacterium kansasii 732]|nr:hypothetical protein I546_2712 [Mycobacterium kansasii 732]